MACISHQRGYVVHYFLTAVNYDSKQVQTWIGHRPDLSTLPPREMYRSRLAGAEIGSQGPLGRLLIRGEPGHDIISELYPLRTEPIVDKPMRSAFAHTDFDLILRNRGVRNLVLCGVTTDVCVLSTMKEACDKGYECVLVRDGCAAATVALHDATVESVKMEGGIAGAVATVREVIDSINGLGGPNNKGEGQETQREEQTKRAVDDWIELQLNTQSL
jgi:nicotinamidase-related amidase